MLPAAILINFLLGILYGWSLFIVPIESQLAVSRTALSIVPAVGLLCFTLGIWVHHLLIPLFQIRFLASSVTAIAGFGHFIFWLSPSYYPLLIGYGVIFGIVAGIGYGLALAMARQSSLTHSGLAVGITVAAFAASGMAVSALGTIYPIQDNIPRLFGFIGAVFCVSAIFLICLLWRSKLSFDTLVDDKEREKDNELNSKIPTIPFLCLMLGYFSLCYSGLVLVSHGTAILQSLGTTYSISALSPFILNSGYIVGALLGGYLPSLIPGRGGPIAVLIVTTVCLTTMIIPFPIVFHVISIFGIGAGLGSVVSVFFMLLSYKYKPERASAIFGRLNISYGLAGMLAPSITGKLYDSDGSYDTSLWFAIIVSIVGIIAIFNSTTSLQK